MRSLKRSKFALRVVAGTVALLLLVALVGLVSGPGRGLRGDIARQKQLITAQLEITKTQLDLTKQQLELTKRQLGISSETLDVAQQQLAIAQQQLARTDITIELQRRLLAIAQETLEQARQINRKTVDASGGTSPPLPRP